MMDANISMEVSNRGAHSLMGVNSKKVDKSVDLGPLTKPNKAYSVMAPSIPGAINSARTQGDQSSQGVQLDNMLVDLDVDKELETAETTLEFILISLGAALGMRPKQAAGLLSNNHQYLIHVAVKGTKGNDFTKLMSWY